MQKLIAQMYPNVSIAQLHGDILRVVSTSLRHLKTHGIPLHLPPPMGPRRNLAVPVSMVATALIAVSTLQKEFKETPTPVTF